MDFQAYLTETRAVIAAGKYPEALERCLWYHENSRAAVGMGGVRLSFALSEWEKLGGLYPPAHEAMAKTRDDELDKLQAVGGDFSLFQEVAAFNRALHEDSKTVDEFVQLAKAHPTDAERYWPVAEDVVYAYKRYDIVKDYVGDVQREYDKAVEQRMTLLGIAAKSASGGTHLTGFADDAFVKKAIRLIAFAKASGNLEGAQRLVGEAEAVVPDTRYAAALAE